MLLFALPPYGPYVPAAFLKYINKAFLYSTLLNLSFFDSETTLHVYRGESEIDEIFWLLIMQTVDPVWLCHSLSFRIFWYQSVYLYVQQNVSLLDHSPLGYWRAAISPAFDGLLKIWGLLRHFYWNFASNITIYQIIILLI